MPATFILCLLVMHSPPKQDGCWCNRLRSSIGGWCQQCDVGYVAGVRIESEMFVEAMDTHGHAVDPATLACADCRAAARSNGICRRCDNRFVDNKIYASPLTYYLALGAPDMGPPACRQCSTRPSDGWCDVCRTGRVAHFRFHDRDTWRAAAEQVRLLHSAVEVLPRCPLCAYACYGGTTCRICGIRYRDGRPVDGAPATPRPPQAGQRRRGPGVPPAGDGG